MVCQEMKLLRVSNPVSVRRSDRFSVLAIVAIVLFGCTSNTASREHLSSRHRGVISTLPGISAPVRNLVFLIDYGAPNANLEWNELLPHLQSGDEVYVDGPAKASQDICQSRPGDGIMKDEIPT